MIFAPAARTRLILLALGGLGLLLACAGLVALLTVNDRFVLGRWLLIGSSLILTPLFGYVMSLRGRGRRAARRRALARKDELDAQLRELVTPEAIRATADTPPEPPRPEPPA